MVYMGSKSKISKYILPIIHERLQDYGIHTYIEPFCGGCNMIVGVDCERKIASDKQKYIIELLMNAEKVKQMPEEIKREHYAAVRECYKQGNSEYEDWYIGAVGFLASYKGRFFDGGYSGIVHTKDGTIRNYYREARNNLIRQSEKLQGIEFKCCDYREYTEFENCLFYLDPPYKGTKQYGINKEFDHEEFWNWCRKMSEKNIVLISEQCAPSDFECIWEMPAKRTINNSEKMAAVERLFEIRE